MGIHHNKETRQMKYYCMDKRHEHHLTSLMQEDGTPMDDMERISLFYIIAGNEALYSRRSTIYDFKGHCIKEHMADGREDLSSGLQALIKLGYNLYNGYRDKYMTPLELFWNLDSKNREIAGKAIWLRFDIHPFP